MKKSISAAKAQSPIIENRIKVDALCKLLKCKAHCTAGAYAAGEAAGELYLDLLRPRDRDDAWKVVDLGAIVQAICANRWPELMLHGFVGALHWPLYVGARATPPSEHKSIEELMTSVRTGLEKTQRESDREFNSEKSKRGWQTRRARMAGAQEAAS